MANFAKEQLMKYGWAEGKGLGKNEDGITKPVKLVTCQNKASIGYDNNYPSWEQLYNDVSKKIIIKSHGDKVSLPVVNNMDTLHRESELSEEKTVSQSRHDGVVTPGIVLKMPCESDKLDYDLRSDTAMQATMMYNQLGKLGRIAEQDRMLLNKSPLNAIFQEKNSMAYRQTGVESDGEEKVHEIPNNENYLFPFKEKGVDFQSKFIKKKNKKKINELIVRLGTFNLKDGDKCSDRYVARCGKREFLKTCQEIKKKEKKVDSSVLLNCLPSDTNESVTQSIASLTPEHYIKPYGLHQFEIEKSKRKRNQFQLVPQLENCRNKKENLEHKIELNPELKIMSIREPEKKLGRDWLTFNIEQPKNINCNSIFPTFNSMQIFSTSENIKNLDEMAFPTNIRLEPLPYDTIIDTSYRMRRLNDKIQKKKDGRNRSKHMKKVFEKLTGETIAREIFIDI